MTADSYRHELFCLIKVSGHGLHFPWHEVLVAIGRSCVPGQQTEDVSVPLYFEIVFLDHSGIVS